MRILKDAQPLGNNFINLYLSHSFCFFPLKLLSPGPLVALDFLVI